MAMAIGHDGTLLLLVAVLLVLAVGLTAALLAATRSTAATMRPNAGATRTVPNGRRHR